MHMADALVSVAVGGGMCAVSAASLGYAGVKIRRDERFEGKIPLMAVSGAFVFAAQMINFTIPGTGSSGHIGGGILLAAMLGGCPALLAIAAVLVIQCLFFADGGLLALGCNIFNMGVIPCLIVYPLVFKPIARDGGSAARLGVAAVAGSVVALQLGAFAVVLETLLSGITELPFGAFAALMQPIHLAIGAVEGAVTAAVLIFVHRARPEILAGAGASGGKGAWRVPVALAVAALLIGGGLSLFASANPDGLEWAVERTAGEEPEAVGAVMENAARVQDTTALMPDYDFRAAGEEGSPAGGSVAGVVGGVLTFALAGGVALTLSAAKKRGRRLGSQG